MRTDDGYKLIISSIEAWKRSVIHKIENQKTKLRLLNPKIYNSLLITFYVFSSFKNRPNNAFNFEHATVDEIWKFSKKR